MYKILFLMFFLAKLVSQEVNFDNKFNYSIKPIWEDDKHFCYYKSLCIISELDKIENIVSMLMNGNYDNDLLLSSIKQEIKNLRVIICPVER